MVRGITPRGSTKRIDILSRYCPKPRTIGWHRGSSSRVSKNNYKGCPGEHPEQHSSTVLILPNMFTDLPRPSDFQARDNTFYSNETDSDVAALDFSS